ncbi:MAG: phenylacetate--CoA ligase, partial [Kocuria sp.]|nr:phenylacetate--CoA ligase [Kocuria sp.]
MTTCSIDNPYSPTASADPTQPDPEELMSRDEIEALQVERLKWTLHNAYENVPAYRELYDEHGVHPSQFQELSDLSKFPYTDKEFLRNAYPFKSFAVPMSEIRRVHASSGTTGLPTVVGYTQD